MHYVARRSHQMQKHKFGRMCPNALSVKSILVPPEHERYWVDVSRPRCTGMHYVTHRSHQIQKQKFGITCPEALFVKSVSVPPGHENSASMFRAPDAPKCICDPHIPLDAKTQVLRNVSYCAFFKSVLVPPEHEK
jgi:hypothetical protein